MIGTIIGPPEGEAKCGVGQRGDFTSHHDVAPVPGVRVAHAIRQETERPQNGYNVRAVVDTSAGTDIVGEKGGNGETCTQQNRYFIPVSPIHPLAKNLSGRMGTDNIISPTRGMPYCNSAENTSLPGEAARPPAGLRSVVFSKIQFQEIEVRGCAEIDLAEVVIRIPAPSIPSTAKNLCTEASA